MAVRIVTDSTADIPNEVAENLDIVVVPLMVFFGDQAYRDGLDLGNDEFYQKLQESKDLPTTSQPSPAAFIEVYTRLIEEGADAILSIQLSSSFSGTFQSACNARDALPTDLQKIPIEVVDSESTSIGLGMSVIRAAEEAREGLGLEEIKANALSRLKRTHILAALDNLDTIRRGGRIGGASAFLGNMLSFKPIIGVKDGKVVPIERPRSRSKAFDRLVQLLLESGEIEQLAIVESGSEVGEQLAAALKPAYPKDVPRYKMGAALGTHTGPGTAGFVFITR